MSKGLGSLLPHVSFNIMLALSLKPRHGYEIMQQIESDTKSYVTLGPGALYGAIKQLRNDNLIEEVPADDGNERRRYYRLTKKGWDRLSQEIDYYESIIGIARQRTVGF